MLSHQTKLLVADATAATAGVVVVVVVVVVGGGGGAARGAVCCVCSIAGDAIMISVQVVVAAAGAKL